ncbi:DUF1273 domain-containing protein [Paenibacillus yanchengensis]|uniref:DUF1273 domain-containing protein n=1 Tax=Paenibacillus yanchengensis TaxID=2035833 RepID=A0ABW4YNS7_9BACL
MKSVWVTGYRAHELQIYNDKHQAIPYIKQAIKQHLFSLLDDGLEWIITCGQYGTDLWACEVAYELKVDYPHLQVAIIAAFNDYAADWKEDRKQFLAQMISQADYYTSTSNRAYEGPWQFKARDQLLLRRTDGLLLFYDEEASVASPRYTLQQAKQKQDTTDYPILLISFDTVQSLIEDSHQQID